MSRRPTPIKWRAVTYESPDGRACLACSLGGWWIVAVRDRPLGKRRTLPAARRLAERLMSHGPARRNGAA